MTQPRYTLWGDSIGRGIDFDAERGRYAVIRRNFTTILKERGTIDIDNRSRFGATVVDGLRDFEQSDKPIADNVVLEFGGNDCNMPWEAVAKQPDVLHQAATPIEQFEQVLTRFAQALMARGKRVLLVTPPPLIAERFVPWVSQGLNAENILKYVGDVSHVYRWHERYANAVRRVAQQLMCPLLDLRDRLLAQPNYPSLVGIDGMHINQHGHEVIATVLEGLLKEAQDVGR